MDTPSFQRRYLSEIHVFDKRVLVESKTILLNSEKRLHGTLYYLHQVYCFAYIFNQVYRTTYFHCFILE